MCVCVCYCCYCCWLWLLPNCAYFWRCWCATKLCDMWQQTIKHATPGAYAWSHTHTHTLSYILIYVCVSAVVEVVFIWQRKVVGYVGGNAKSCACQLSCTTIYGCVCVCVPSPLLRIIYIADTHTCAYKVFFVHHCRLEWWMHFVRCCHFRDCSAKLPPTSSPQPLCLCLNHCCISMQLSYIYISI